MPNIIAVTNSDGSVTSISSNWWTDPSQDPVVTDPVTPPGDFELKAPDEEKAHAERPARKAPSRARRGSK